MALRKVCGGQLVCGTTQGCCLTPGNFTDIFSLAVVQDGDRQLNELWGLLVRVIPQLFKGITVTPSLLHGDLWSGNVGESDQGPGNCELTIY